MIRIRIATYLLYGALLLTASHTTEANDLFVDNESSWQIVLPAKSDPTENYAAMELQAVILKMSGVLLPITTGEDPQGSNLIILGTPQSNPLVRDKIADLILDEDSPEKIAVYTIEGNLYLAGNSPRAVLYSVYTFLQDIMQVQWLWPGDDGEFIPHRSQFSLPDLAINKTPAFQYRGLHLVYQHVSDDYETWMARNFVNIMRSEPRHGHVESDRRMKGLHIMFSSHNATLPKDVFELHPEYFALVNGVRVPWQLCHSNRDAEEEVISIVKGWLKDYPDLEILSMFPSDNTQYCQCDTCAKVSISTNWFDSFKRVCEAVKPGYPDLKFSSIAYQGYLDVPETDLSWVEFIEYCQYNHCYIHQYGDKCELNDNSLKSISNWTQKGVPMGLYGYEFDIFTLHTAENLNIPLYSRIPDQIRKLEELNMKFVITEVPINNAKGDREASKQNRLGMYLYAQLLWNPDLSLDSLIDQWNQRVYGDLANDMRRIQNEMMDMWDSADMHLTMYTHYAPDVVKEMLTPDRIATISELFRTVKTNLSAINDPSERKRVATNIEWEEVLFSQWVEAYWSTVAPPKHTINLRKSEDGDLDFSSMSKVIGVAQTNIGMNWSDTALNYTIIFQDLTGPSSGHSDGVQLRIKNIKDYKSQYREITLHPDGTYISMLVPVGTEAPSDWEAKLETHTKSTPGGQVVVLSIPFTGDFPKPKETETWLFSIKRILSTKNDRTSYPPESEAKTNSFANLYFSGELAIDKRLLMLLPNQATISESTLLMKELTQDGWNYNYALDPKALEEDLSSYDIICFYTPKDSSFSNENIGLVAKKALNMGKVVIFGGYGDLPLDEYLNDPSCTVVGSGWEVNSLPAQSTSSPWNTAPNNLLSIINESAPPIWGYAPTHPEYWKELATLKTLDDKVFPYLIAREYDEGLLVVGGGNLGTGGGWALFGNLRPKSVRMLFNNLLEYSREAND